MLGGRADGERRLDARRTSRAAAASWPLRAATSATRPRSWRTRSLSTRRADDTFGRARALLALGVVRRRQRQKRAARDAIEAALDGFEQLGAATWIERAHARSWAGSADGRASEGLTAAERRVAALVAEGRTNREVAAALFLGERTVETHLSHVYAKLGVRSRAELARAISVGRAKFRGTHDFKLSPAA